MTQFKVYADGNFMGVFGGEDKISAALAMHRDAGYRSTEEVAAQLGKTVDQILDEITVEAAFDIESVRENGISYAGVKLAYDHIELEWYLKVGMTGGIGGTQIAWAAERDGGWKVCTPSSSNPFELADILGDDLTEEEAVIMLGELGRQATTKAA